MSAPLIAFVKDSASGQVLSQAFAKYGARPYVIYPGGLLEAIAHFCTAPSPPLLLVDCSGSDRPLALMKELLQVCVPGTPIIALGDQSDVTLFRELLRLQVKDYLLKPLLSQVVLKAIEEADANEAPSTPFSPSPSHSPESHLGKVVAFTGVRGGVGSTTLALNVAEALANDRGRKVALLDMDSYFGALNIYLDLSPNAGLHEIFVTPERIDSLLLERVMTPFGERLHVLSAPLSLRQESAAGTEVGVKAGLQIGHLNMVFQKILSLLCPQYHYVILDLPPMPLERLLAFQPNISLQCLVSDLSIAGLRDTLRLQEFLINSSTPSRTLILLNKDLPSSRTQFQSKEFAEALGHPVDFIFSNDPYALECANVGVPLRYKSRVFASEINKLVEGITGEGAVLEKHSPFKAFFNLRRFLS